MAPCTSWRTSTAAALLTVLIVGAEAAASIREDRALKAIVESSEDTCSIVTTPCTSSAGQAGQCMKTGVCSQYGGTHTTSSACTTSGHSCCVVAATGSCGSTLKKTMSYIATPSTFATDTSCEFKFARLNSNICQFRLDFDKLETAAPTPISTAGLGRCTDESVSVTDGHGRNLITICGNSTGQHMYLDAGQMDAALLFTGPFLSTTDFRIRVSQIACKSNCRAPDGCLQYHMADYGSIESFNYAGGQLLENMDYGICIREGDRKCGVKYTEDPDEAQAFLMSTREWSATAFADGSAGGVGMAGPLQGSELCASEAFVTIQGGYTDTSMDTSGANNYQTPNDITTPAPRYRAQDIFTPEEQQSMMAGRSLPVFDETEDNMEGVYVLDDESEDDHNDDGHIHVERSGLDEVEDLNEDADSSTKEDEDMNVEQSDLDVDEDLKEDMDVHIDEEDTNVERSDLHEDEEENENVDDDTDEDENLNEEDAELVTKEDANEETDETETGEDTDEDTEENSDESSEEDMEESDNETEEENEDKELSRNAELPEDEEENLNTSEIEETTSEVEENNVLSRNTRSADDKASKAELKAMRRKKNKAKNKRLREAKRKANKKAQSKKNPATKVKKLTKKEIRERTKERNKAAKQRRKANKMRNKAKNKARNEKRRANIKKARKNSRKADSATKKKATAIKDNTSEELSDVTKNIAGDEDAETIPIMARTDEIDDTESTSNEDSEIISDEEEEVSEDSVLSRHVRSADSKDLSKAKKAANKRRAAKRAKTKARNERRRKNKAKNQAKNKRKNTKAANARKSNKKSAAKTRKTTPNKRSNLKKTVAKLMAKKTQPATKKKAASRKSNKKSRRTKRSANMKKNKRPAVKAKQKSKNKNKKTVRKPNKKAASQIKKNKNKKSASQIRKNKNKKAASQKRKNKNKKVAMKQKKEAMRRKTTNKKKKKAPMKQKKNKNTKKNNKIAQLKRRKAAIRRRKANAKKAAMKRKQAAIKKRRVVKNRRRLNKIKEQKALQARKNNKRKAIARQINAANTIVDLSLYGNSGGILGPQERYCGFHLNGRSQDVSGDAMENSFVAANIKEPVMSSSMPISLYVYSVDAETEMAAFPQKLVNPVGFKLQYDQTTC